MIKTKNDIDIKINKKLTVKINKLQSNKKLEKPRIYQLCEQMVF